MCLKVKRSILILFLLLSVDQSMAQVDTVKTSATTVLIVPYNRFKFHTEFTLEEIAEHNQVETSKVYSLFQDALLAGFINSNCSTVNFKIIDEVNAAYLARRVTYGMHRKPTYYASELTRLNEEDLTRILEGFDADYIMFINWYHIKKDAVSSMAYQRTVSAFSMHYVDYDIYDSTKKIITWGAEYKFEQLLNEKTFNAKGLNISSLLASYRIFAEKICEDL